MTSKITIQKTLLFLVVAFFALNGKALNFPPLIPMPDSITVDPSNSYLLTEQQGLSSLSKGLENSIDELQSLLKKRGGFQLTLVESPKAGISLEIDTTLSNAEHYRLIVSEKGIHLTGSSPQAVYRGIMTLDQLLLDAEVTDEGIRLPYLTINDSPRFPYRALMLDPARNFLPVEDVKFFIDQMAKYKFNVLQLHLSDDQGWRVEIDQFPELNSDLAYSKNDIRDIIEYAGTKYIEVVPEFDIPGHTSAFLSVYPDLGCTNHQGDTIVVGKTDNRMLCAANPKVYEIFEGIISEMADLFPSSRIHLGGDEAAIKKNWALCDSCLALMNKLGYDKPEQLMIPFFNQMLGFVRDNGKKAILWCELDNIYPPANDFLFPYPEDVTLVTWRAGLTPKCFELTGRNNYPLIMAPGEYAYLDYPQLKGDLPEFNNWGMPVTTLEKSYEFDPGYGTSKDEHSHILGVMGTLWGEAIKDINRATYMAFPRALALAEAGWSPMNKRDWQSFKARMYPNLYDLMQNGVSFRVPYEISR